MAKIKTRVPGSNITNPLEHSQIKDDIAQILLEYGVQPAVRLAQAMLQLDELYASKEHQLTFKEQLDYYKLIFNTNLELAGYQFAKAARKTEISTKSLALSLDPTSALNLLKDRAFQKAQAAYAEKNNLPFTPPGMSQLNKMVEKFDSIEISHSDDDEEYL